jgi:hypothetical protein
MTTEVAMSLEERPVSPRRKRTKLAKTGHSGAKQPASLNVIHIFDAHTIDVAPLKRQYFTRSRVAMKLTLASRGLRTLLPLISGIEEALLTLLHSLLFDLLF